MWNNRIKEHGNLIEAQSIGLFWGGNEFYPKDKISLREEELVKRITCIEVTFPGIKGNRDDHNRLFENYYKYIAHYFINEKCFLIKTEHKKGIINKVRSYKGVVNKSIIPSNYFISKEEDLENGYSIILSLVDLEQKIYDAAIELFVDRATSCIIIPMGLNVYNEQFLKVFASNYMIHDSTSRINYQKLIIDYCSMGALILRIGGDGGEEKVTLEVFCLKDNRNYSPIVKMLLDTPLSL